MVCLLLLIITPFEITFGSKFALRLKRLDMIKDNYIVYVEDDPDDRMLLQEAFESNKDYSLLTLVNGFELFNYLKHTDERKLPCAIVP